MTSCVNTVVGDKPEVDPDIAAAMIDAVCQSENKSALPNYLGDGTEEFGECGQDNETEWLEDNHGTVVECVCEASCCWWDLYDYG